MPLFQMKDAFGNWIFCGDGVVYAKSKDPASHRALANGEKKTPKTFFYLKTSVNVRKDEEGNTIYEPQTIPCAVYGVKENETVYSYSQSLQKGDKIFIVGKLWEKTVQTGEANGVKYKEIQVSTIIPVDAILMSLMGIDSKELSYLQIKSAREQPLTADNKKRRRGKGDLPF